MRTVGEKVLFIMVKCEESHLTQSDVNGPLTVASHILLHYKFVKIHSDSAICYLKRFLGKAALLKALGLISLSK